MVYGRSYAERELRFEPSGGLIHASLVMQDKETDTYWSIMTGTALAGELEGTPLRELSVGLKSTWSEWVAAHPDTVVLSVGGVEHVESNPYDNYFRSETGFRGAEATDVRLPTKTPVYAFRLDDRAYAVPFSAFEGGASFVVGERTVLVHRPFGASLFRSSTGWVVDGAVEERDGRWITRDGASFDPATGRFDSAEPGRLEGFDTYWFNWSMTHPETEVLGAAAPSP